MIALSSIGASTSIVYKSLVDEVFSNTNPPGSPNTFENPLGTFVLAESKVNWDTSSTRSGPTNDGGR